MSVEILGWTALLSVVPISELRGAIPFAVTQGIHPVTAYFFAVFFNALVGPIVFIFLNSFHKLFSRMNWYTKIFDDFVEKTRHKVEDKINRFGYWGVALFVAIPLPITGAWTGTLGAWIFGLKKRKTILAVILGVCISGLIVSLITFFGVETLSFL
ncbi:MAG: small multi-drug export protein, partial [Spirochaetaceae bacterium]|nr:small multi-drug export protein [Spirochaetaceae bacterium]